MSKLLPSLKKKKNKFLRFFHHPLIQSSSPLGSCSPDREKEAAARLVHRGKDSTLHVTLTPACPSTFQEGAVGSVGVSGLVRPADSDSTGEPGTRGAGRHLLQHAHAAADAQRRGHAPPAQKGERRERTRRRDHFLIIRRRSCAKMIINKTKKNKKQTNVSIRPQQFRLIRDLIVAGVLKCEIISVDISAAAGMNQWDDRQVCKKICQGASSGVVD